MVLKEPKIRIPGIRYTVLLISLHTNITMMRVCNAYLFYHTYFSLPKPIFPAMKKILEQIQTIGPHGYSCAISASKMFETEGLN